MVRSATTLLLTIVAILSSLSVRAQYSDTLTVTINDSVTAFTPENMQRFGYLAPHIDPYIVYAQYFWATNRFDPKLMKNNNPFQSINAEGKRRKFDSEEQAIARFILAIADYNVKKESYTDYMERKPKANWSPLMSKKLLEIYRGLYGQNYNYKKQLRTWKPGHRNLTFAKFDSLTSELTKDKYGRDVKPYQKSFAITATDKNMIQPRLSLGPLQPLANKVDTGLIFVQVIWATNHFNERSIKNNNLFQITDEQGELIKYDSREDCIADYLIRILDYDQSIESYLAYLERRSNGQWTSSMSDKMRKLYRALFHKNYDESGFKGYKAQKEEKNRTSTARSRNRL